MNMTEIDEIIQCLPSGRTLLYYFKDRYAFELLAKYLETPKSVHEVKRSPYRGLLNKPMVQRAVAHYADGILTQERLRSYWPVDPIAFTLSLGRWGAKKRSHYYQTSRTGHNVVLHLNFSNQHNECYRRNVNPGKGSPFTYSGHPGNGRGQNTIAWARMDIDLVAGVALIEEIQNDWLRNARSDYKYLKRFIEDGLGWDDIKFRYPFHVSSYEAVRSEEYLVRYFENCVRPYERIWEEAMLYAAIWFLRDELGIRRVFYNTWETGSRMKGLDLNASPPKSVYTTLPRRFCFEETDEYPEFVAHRVRQVKRKHRWETMRWFRLDL